jgi:hypothetical protein
MAKPKRAPLYEVLSKSKNPPFWTQGHEDGADGPDESAVPPERVDPGPDPPQPPVSPEAVRPPERPAEPVGLDGGEAASEPLLRIDGRLIRIALDSTRAAVAVFALVVLMGAAWMLGHGSGRESGMDEAWKAARAEGMGTVDEMDRIREGAPQPNVTEGVGASPFAPDKDPAAPPRVAPPSTTLASRAETGAAVSSAEWTPGLTYIVVQDFAWSARADALRAQEYLRQYSIETSLEETSGKWYHLIATQGFNWDDSTDRDRYDRYLRRIQTIGQTYYKNGGRYKLEGYAKKLTRDHW